MEKRTIVPLVALALALVATIQVAMYAGDAGVSQPLPSRDRERVFSLAT